MVLVVSFVYINAVANSDVLQLYLGLGFITQYLKSNINFTQSYGQSLSPSI